ncbi:hypothetical protein BH23PLA1_BH23PLA1_03710 [soil metagenome]
MRCTRCQGLAVPQAIGRDRQGRLIFGWCLRCLREEGCRISSVSGEIQPSARVFRASKPAAEVETRADWTGTARRQGLRGLAILLLAWALILVAFGRRWTDTQAIPVGAGLRPAPLLLGGAILFVIGLGLLLATIDQPKIARKLLQVARWGSVVLAFGALAWGILGNDPKRNLVVLAIVVGAVIVSTVSQWLEGRLDGRSADASPPHSPARPL